MRGPQRLDDVPADGFLLRELQLAQRAVADVMVRDISTRVVQESTNAVLWHRRLPAQAARQLPDQSTTLHVESSSTDDSRLRGALPTADIRDDVNEKERPPCGGLSKAVRDVRYAALAF